MTKITTIRAASENAGDTGIICVDGVNVYWDGYAVEFADCGGSWDIDPDTEIIDIGNGAYKLAKPERLVARIFEDIGGYYVCDDDLDYRDTRGPVYPTKAAALRAAAEDYTHATGSGTYWGDAIRSLAQFDA
jgi:hypothetical protein